MLRIFLALLLLICQPCFASEPLDDTKPYAGFAMVGAARAKDMFTAAGVGKRFHPRTGVLITSVPEGSPAFKQGARPLDVITNLGKARVSSLADWDKQIAKYKPGDTVSLKIKRWVGVWKTIDGQLELTTKRRAFYDALSISASDVSGTQTATHVSLSPMETMLSPIIVSSDGEPSLVFRYKRKADDWLFPEKITIRVGRKVFSTKFPLAKIDSDVLPNEASVYESVTFAMPEDMIDMLRNDADSAMMRVDGRSSYVEGDLPNAHAVSSVIAVYDDMIARKLTKLAD